MQNLLQHLEDEIQRFEHIIDAPEEIDKIPWIDTASNPSASLSNRINKGQLLPLIFEIFFYFINYQIFFNNKKKFLVRHCFNNC